MNIQCNSNAILAQNQTSPFWTSNCTLMTMSRSRFEGCLNTVWTPFEGVSLLRLFSGRIYTILRTGVGTCTRTHYARIRAQKRGFVAPVLTLHEPQLVSPFTGRFLMYLAPFRCACTRDGQRRSNARPSFEHPILGEITTKYKQNHHFETFGFYCTFMSKSL